MITSLRDIIEKSIGGNLDIIQKKYRARYEVPAGSYEANSILGLCWKVLKHRCWHLWKHKRWMD
jgi:hypothetical protein